MDREHLIRETQLQKLARISSFATGYCAPCAGFGWDLLNLGGNKTSSDQGWRYQATGLLSGNADLKIERGIGNSSFAFEAAKFNRTRIMNKSPMEAFQPCHFHFDMLISQSKANGRSPGSD